MNIADRHIGPSTPPYVIAEIGVNHDGQLDRAIELINAAAQAGASAVKFQSFSADLLLSNASKLADYQSTSGEQSPASMLARLELPHDQLAAACLHARTLGLHAIVTVFSSQLIHAAEQLTIDAYKTASPDLINKPLLQQLAATGKPLIVSTGAATLEEVRQTIDWLQPLIDHKRLAILHCVSAYPTPLEHAALAGIRAIESLAPGITVGYSDHTQSTETGAIAVAAGAHILEKHLTHNRNAPGPDHAASLEPHQLADYIQRATAARTMLGQGKAVANIEREVRALSRQSIVAARDIAAGETLTKEALCIKRPGTGLAPWMLEDILGTHTTRHIPANTPLTNADINWTNTTTNTKTNTSRSPSPTNQAA